MTRTNSAYNVRRNIKGERVTTAQDCRRMRMLYCVRFGILEALNQEAAINILGSEKPPSGRKPIWGMRRPFGRWMFIHLHPGWRRRQEVWDHFVELDIHKMDDWELSQELAKDIFYYLENHDHRFV